MTTFDSLTADLLFEVFDYLSFTDIFHAFFNLQQCINDVICAYPACIDLSNSIDRNALIHGPFKCRSLIVTDDDSEKNQPDYLSLNFEPLRAIQFKYTNLITVQSIFQRLPIEQIESITINNFYKVNSSGDIHQEIWSKIVIAGQNHLRYLHLSLHMFKWDVEQLLFDLPSLQHVNFHQISVDEMMTFVRHTPNICSLTGQVSGWNTYNHVSNFTLVSLRRLNLSIQGCNSFTTLQEMLSLCPNLIELNLRLWIIENNAMMVDAVGWQTLVEQYLPFLMYLKVRLFRFVRPFNDDSNPDETFAQSDYWLTRKPNFDIKV